MKLAAAVVMALVAVGAAAQFTLGFAYATGDGAPRTDAEAVRWCRLAVAGVYNYNNDALLRFDEQIKDGIDPNGILSPGRGGVWPKRFRKA